ncbi:MAG: tetratricopeptide repeat protein [Bryobacterales bacterium]|nr:tetratricopeptide repeat protein [Bryobacterales bacterium]
MKHTDRDSELDDLIDEITTDASGEAEQLWAFRQAFEDEVEVPCEASVIGEPVQVLKFDFDGNERRGLTALCLRADGTKHVVTASEMVIPPGKQGGRYLAAYRKWMGIAPMPPSVRPATRRNTSVPVPALEGPVELVVLSVKQKAARCRLLGAGQAFTFRAGRLWNLVPGEIAAVKPAKQWTYGGNPYLSGVIESTRLDAKALGLAPLGLEEVGIWSPAEHYWGEEGDPIEEWARPIIARGPRPEFEMEQVLPGFEVEDPFSDPIGQSNDLKDAGDFSGAYKILMALCQADLRCLDAHSHLGNFVFDRRPEDAIRHYEVGFRIGELSLGESFDGLLSWVRIDNRPFLRCMHGFGLCLWRLGRFEEAAEVFDRMLWLNPSDNQGVRFIVEDVRAKAPWRDE